MSSQDQENTKRKYLLFKANDGRPDTSKPCAFFLAVEGCRNGSNCKFSHGNIPTKASNNIPISNVNSESESESESDVDEKPIQPIRTQTNSMSAMYPPIPQLHPTNSITKPIPTPIPTPIPIQIPKSEKTSSKTKKQKTEHEEDTAFLNSVVNHAIESIVRPSPITKESTQMNTSSVFSSTSHLMGFVPSFEEESPFKIENKRKPKTERSRNVSSNEQVSVQSIIPPVTIVASIPQPIVQKIIPCSQSIPSKTSFTTPTSWTELLERSKSHPKYIHDFSFSDIDSSWISSKPIGQWCTNLPSIVAIDCEMCQSTDPVTGVNDTNTLIRFSIIDIQNMDEPMNDLYITPIWPITDMRTNIHGITEDKLKGSLNSLRQVQGYLLKTISENTIVIGHGLINDFKALHFQHKFVIDTSYLYNLEIDGIATTKFPSLREIADIILKRPLPLVHDSVEDAKAAVFACFHLFQPNAITTIQRYSNNSNTNTHTTNGHVNPPMGANTLLAHRIPDSCSEQDIYQLFLAHTYIAPLKIFPILGRGGGDKGKATIVFSTKEHAILSFDSIAGPNRPDKQNKPQKRVYLKTGGYICIRKNHEN